MKQIFEWLREQTQEALVSNKLRIGLGMKLVVPYNCFTDLINEAEAKWEAEVCEWKRFKNFELIIAPHDKTITLQTFDLKDYPYCPVCGKPIKISEVE